MKTLPLTLLLTLILSACGADDATTPSKADTGTSRYKQIIDTAEQSAGQLENALSGSADRADDAVKQAH